MKWPLGLVKKDVFKGIKGRVMFEEPLDKHTSFKIGGPAKIFIEPSDASDIKLSVSLAKRHNLPIFVIGAGSNLLVSDKGVNGMFLHLGSIYFRRISGRARCLNVGSGLGLGELIRFARERGLGGLEFLAGIPGTVGGALAMNAGSRDKSIGDLVENAEVMDYNNKIKTLSKEDIKFDYRKSSLAKYIILSANIRLAQKNKKEVGGSIKKYLGLRSDTQDVSLPNAGCIFKNPLGESAGRLIDLCGLKGMRAGGAYVSGRHANFILNRKHATSGDVLKLMDIIKKRVKRKFNINLEPEIRIWR